MENDDNTSNPRGFWFYVAIGSAVLIIAFSIILTSSSGTNLLPFEPNFERTGQFGDSFGAISAIMAMIAAASAFATYRSQSEELNRVRKSEDRRDASEAKRDFENTFFNLLKMFREVVRDTDVEASFGPNPTGNDAYSAMLRAISSKINEMKRYSNPDVPPDDQMSETAFRKIYSTHQNDLGHYFRLFYHVLRFIDESKMIDKFLYTRLLRATLSGSEMALIALNCIHGSGKPKLKLLVERYAMLHNMSSEQVKFWSLTRHFEASAFGDRTIYDDGSLSY